jgi:hypothetical protein
MTPPIKSLNEVKTKITAPVTKRVLIDNPSAPFLPSRVPRSYEKKNNERPSGNKTPSTSTSRSVMLPGAHEHEHAREPSVLGIASGSGTLSEQHKKRKHHSKLKKSKKRRETSSSSPPDLESGGESDGGVYISISLGLS